MHITYIFLILDRKGDKTLRPCESYEELFEILTLKQLGKHAKPIALLNTDNYYLPLFAMLENTVARGFMSERCLSLFKLCATPEDALAHVLTDRAEAANLQYGLLDYNR